MASSYACVLCGHRIEQSWHNLDRDVWAKEFRILYSNTKGTWISGVGSRDIASELWIVPLADSARREGDNLYNMRVHIGVMDQPPVEDHHGFVFHNVCWSLLERLYGHETVPYARLLEVCRSLPLLHGHAYWRHDYDAGRVPGGFITNLPFIVRPMAFRRDHIPSNPYDVPGLQHLLAEHELVRTRKASQRPSVLVVSRNDCFATLPQELCDEIAAFLPLVDVLNVRKVSRAFAHVFSHQHFWASRFWPNGERGWLFESQELSKPVDWKSLYRDTGHLDSDYVWKNRIRVWNLAKAVKDILDLARVHSVEQRDLSRSRWTRMSVCRSRCCRAFQGCIVSGKQSVSVPTLSGIGFTVIKFGDVQFVSGLRLVTKGGADITLGYFYAGRNAHFLDLSVLMGFNLAVGPVGINAIQVIYDNGSVSQWFGNPDGFPKTQRLAAFGRITSLKVSFDAWKLLSLAVQRDEPGALSSLREKAIWYPDIPPPTSHVSIGSRMPMKEILYSSLSWVSFGGDCGSDLQHLANITVKGRNAIESVEFHYIKHDLAVESRVLGFCNPNDTNGASGTFPIDGIGGEVIHALEYERRDRNNTLDTVKNDEEFKPVSLKITTNHGKCFIFSPGARDREDSYLWESIPVEPGTTITGMFAAIDDELELRDFGLISEIVPKAQLATEGTIL